jgi:intergrase/recombinase
MNPEFYARLKHIDIQYHYIRELVENDTVKLEYIQTSEMAVDYLTKPLKRV